MPPVFPPTRLGAGVPLFSEEPALDELLPLNKLPNTPPVFCGAGGVLNESSSFWSEVTVGVRAGTEGMEGAVGVFAVTEGVDGTEGAVGAGGAVLGATFVA